MRRALFTLCAVFGLTLGYCSQPREIRAADQPPRLDKQIRADFMAGFQGDQAALERASAAAAKILEAQPRHAEAMVWLGAATLKLSGDAFLKDGDQEKGTELWKKGNGQMDQAVELEPDNIAVRVTRGSTLPARIFHQPSAAARDRAASTALRSVAVLNVPPSTPAGGSGRAPCICNPLIAPRCDGGEEPGLAALRAR